ncbi:hypothetical protein V495_03357 [Pseudogymnoascus sp. VKM F-4514 (FW-929)]|nr:hypothetical protein V495_03357 [Pseudogymnoascus sp. VKM F-4514 (FW-929)]KFY60846.1 hypothetical protein V497_03329 [Pseudogymnoascus sp. VKM F-4516 (FW-969)]
MQDSSHPRVPPQANTREDFRLPRKVKPVHYDLTLEPVFDTRSYIGDITIGFEVLEDTTQVIIHAEDLTITRAVVYSPAGGNEARFRCDIEAHTITFLLPEPLRAGTSSSIWIAFTGSLRDDISGFYASRYRSLDGSEAFLAMTHMAPTYAKRVFPCFDEPALKATFKVTLIADSGLTCLSNMNIESVHPIETAQGARMATSFYSTPPMSTYVVTCVVGHLTYTEETSGDIPVRIYAPPSDNIQLATYAARLVRRGLAFFEDLFRVRYPLPKLDLLATPMFFPGGTENWGLINMHSNYLLFEEDVDGEDKRALVADTLMHELAHMWLGDLVTLDWWDNLWLNEGGATALGIYCLLKLEPTWSSHEYRQLSGRTAALGIDAYLSTHPIEVPVLKPDDIAQAFDEISYSKGAIVLRMLREYLTPSVFFSGLSDYLTSHSYGNANTNDLWRALEHVSGQDIAALMSPWTKSPGYPFLLVSESAGFVHFEQHRFLSTGHAEPGDDETLWPIFMNLRTSQGIKSSVFKDRHGSFSFHPEHDGFYLLNANYTSMYRTCYPRYYLARLAELGRSGLLSTQERAGLISDTGALAHAGHYKTSTLLELIDLMKETEYLPWLEIAEQYHSMVEAWINDDEILSALGLFYLRLTAPVSHQLGWDFSNDDGHELQLFKALMFAEAGLAGDEQVINASTTMFEAFASGDETAINRDIQMAVFRINLRNGGEREYDIIFRTSISAPSPHSRRCAMLSLLATENSVLVERTLNAIITKEIDPSMAPIALRGLGFSKKAPGMVWEWARRNWSQLSVVFPDAQGSRDRIVRAATRSLSTRSQLTELENLMQQQDIRGVERELALSFENAQGFIFWTERDARDIREWLQGENSRK